MVKVWASCLLEVELNKICSKLKKYRHLIEIYEAVLVYVLLTLSN